MDFPPVHDESAPPFLSTGNQAFSPPQLSLASCLSPGGTIDVDKYRRYTASRLVIARGRSEAILSTMFGDESIPNSIARLSTNLDPRNYDLSNMGPGEDVVGEIYHGDR